MQLGAEVVKHLFCPAVGATDHLRDRSSAILAVTNGSVKIARLVQDQSGVRSVVVENIEGPAVGSARHFKHGAHAISAAGSRSAVDASFGIENHSAERAATAAGIAESMQNPFAPPA